MTELREAIEVAKLLEDWDLGEPAYDLRGAVKSLIKIAKQVISSEWELPEKYLDEQLQKACWCSTQKPTTCGLSLKKYNEALDLCLPILAKYKMRIAELEQQLKDEVCRMSHPSMKLKEDK